MYKDHCFYFLIGFGMNKKVCVLCKMHFRNAVLNESNTSRPVFLQIFFFKKCRAYVINKELMLSVNHNKIPIRFGVYIRFLKFIREVWLHKDFRSHT